MLVTESGIVIELGLVLANALLPMLVTEFEIVIELRFVHEEKEKSPMLVTESEIVIELRFVHEEKEKSPMLVTEVGIMIELRPSQGTHCTVPLGSLKEVKDSPKPRQLGKA